MPVYEFLCRDCDNRFDDLVSLEQALDQSCPECRSGEVVKLYSPFSVGARSGSDVVMGGACGGGACMPGPAGSGGGGGGCCGGGCGGCG